MVIFSIGPDRQSAGLTFERVKSSNGKGTSTILFLII